MTIRINKIFLIADYEVLEVLSWLIPFSALLALATEVFSLGLESSSGFWSWLFIGIILFFLKRTRNGLFYSYWTFAITFLIISALHVSNAQNSEVLGPYILWLAVIFFQLVEMYVLSSPLYYPILKWWEYDFRYRHDVEIIIENEGKKYDGRMVDLRRGAACILSFEDIELGKTINIHILHFPEEMMLTGKVATKRNHSIGRPGIFGIKLNLQSKNNLDTYKQLMRYWRSNIKSKREKKYKSMKHHGS